jgi:hypothetical protein
MPKNSGKADINPKQAIPNALHPLIAIGFLNFCGNLFLQGIISTAPKPIPLNIKYPGEPYISCI